MHKKITRPALLMGLMTLSACIARQNQFAMKIEPAPLMKPVQAQNRTSGKQRVRELFTSFRHGDDRERSEAEKQLLGLRDRSAVPILEHELESRNRDVSFLAARVLAGMGEKRVAPALIAMLQDPDRAFTVLDMLGDLGDKRAVPAVEGMLGSDDPALRSGAAQALGKLSSRSSVPLLLNLMNDRNAGVRKKTADALGMIGDGMAALPLVKALQDKVDYVRAASIEALGRIGEPAIPLLFEAILSGNPSYRLEALESLIAMKEKAVPMLIEAAEYGDTVLKSYAIRALGNINDRRASSVIIKALDDRDAHVRGLAANALRMTGDAAALDKLRTLAQDDPNGFVRAASAAAVDSINQ